MSGSLARLSGTVLVLAACAAPARIVGDGVRIDASPPAFVVPEDLALGGEETDSDEGWHYLLIDRQVRVRGRSVADFTRQVIAIDDEDGVEAWQSVYVDFDPSIHHLAFHRVDIIRAGNAASQLDADALEVDESPWDEQAAWLRASVPLRKLSPGDVIESAWTIEGGEPAFEGRHVEEFDLAADGAVDRMSLRVLVPRGSPLVIAERGPAPRGSRHVLGDEDELTWDLRHVPLLASEDDVPAWIATSPRVIVSGFESWAVVAAWGAHVLAVPPEPGERVRDLAQGFGTDASSEEDRILAALRFVQDEIAYDASDLGTAAWHARAPALVLERGSGDCKDKSVLLCALLAELGVEARPAFVSTELRGHVKDEPPSPFAFDHAIVRIATKDGARWVDPTIEGQRGRLARMPCPDEELALVASRAATDLVPIDCAGSDVSRVEVTMSVYLGSFAEAARLSIDTAYRGTEADMIRTSVVGRNARDLGKEFRDYYARWYPTVSATAEPQVVDDEDTNVITTRESYVVPEFWLAGGGGRRLGLFPKPELETIVGRAPQGERAFPLNVDHPERVVHRTVIHWQGEITGLPDATIRSAAMVAKVSSRLMPGGAIVLADYRSTSDSIPAEALAEHGNAVKELQRAARYELRVKEDVAPLARGGLSRRATVLIGGAACALLLALLFGLRSRRLA